jgi:predicted nucleic-acid-binding protein
VFIEHEARLQEERVYRMNKVLENDEKMRVHHHDKVEHSSKIFGKTKVTSCSSVLMSNGLSLAVPFRSASNAKAIPYNRQYEKIASMTQ